MKKRDPRVGGVTDATDGGSAKDGVSTYIHITKSSQDLIVGRDDTTKAGAIRPYQNKKIISDDTDETDPGFKTALSFPSHLPKKINTDSLMNPRLVLSPIPDDKVIESHSKHRTYKPVQDHEPSTSARDDHATKSLSSDSQRVLSSLQEDQPVRKQSPNHLVVRSLPEDQPMRRTSPNHLVVNSEDHYITRISSNYLTVRQDEHHVVKASSNYLSVVQEGGSLKTSEPVDGAGATSVISGFRAAVESEKVDGSEVITDSSWEEDEEDDDDDFDDDDDDIVHLIQDERQRFTAAFKLMIVMVIPILLVVTIYAENTFEQYLIWQQHKMALLDMNNSYKFGNLLKMLQKNAVLDLQKLECEYCTLPSSQCSNIFCDSVQLTKDSNQLQQRIEEFVEETKSIFAHCQVAVGHDKPRPSHGVLKIIQQCEAYFSFKKHLEDTRKEINGTVRSQNHLSEKSYRILFYYDMLMETVCKMARVPVSNTAIKSFWQHLNLLANWDHVAKSFAIIPLRTWIYLTICHIRLDAEHILTISQSLTFLINDKWFKHQHTMKILYQNIDRLLHESKDLIYLTDKFMVNMSEATQHNETQLCRNIDQADRDMIKGKLLSLRLERLEKVEAEINVMFTETFQALDKGIATSYDNFTSSATYTTLTIFIYCFIILVVISTVYSVSAHFLFFSETVTEKTKQIARERETFDALVNELLPGKIARWFWQTDRQSVFLENFSGVTIFFNDIREFTKISSKSTPQQICDLLNSFYLLLDSISDCYDLYKMETIGDAYMIVSGVPKRNGNRHAFEVACFSLHVKHSVKDFIIPHLEDEHIHIRMGVHSGACAAGVVGKKMPRYTIFGAVVNVAKQLESSGEVGKVHISQDTVNLLKQKDFIFEERTNNELKKKVGGIKTYWLKDYSRSCGLEQSQKYMEQHLRYYGDIYEPNTEFFTHIEKGESIKVGAGDLPGENPELELFNQPASELMDYFGTISQPHRRSKVRSASWMLGLKKDSNVSLVHKKSPSDLDKDKSKRPDSTSLRDVSSQSPWMKLGTLENKGQRSNQLSPFKPHEYKGQRSNQLSPFVTSDEGKLTNPWNISSDEGAMDLMNKGARTKKGSPEKDVISPNRLKYQMTLESRGQKATQLTPFIPHGDQSLLTNNWITGTAENGPEDLVIQKPMILIDQKRNICCKCCNGKRHSSRSVMKAGSSNILLRDESIFEYFDAKETPTKDLNTETRTEGTSIKPLLMKKTPSTSEKKESQSVFASKMNLKLSHKSSVKSIGGEKSNEPPLKKPRQGGLNTSNKPAAGSHRKKKDKHL